MDENAVAVTVALSVFGALASLAFSINAITRAWVARGRDEASLANTHANPPADARLARLEQAVDAIALEVERISESQRFTAKLLADFALAEPKFGQRQLSSATLT